MVEMKNSQVVSKVMGITKDYKIDFEGISNFIKINTIIQIRQVSNVGQKNLWMKTIVQNVKERVCEKNRYISN